MKEQKNIFGLSSTIIVIILGAIVKFALHLYSAPGYGFFGDELYTIALSRHLAFGYVDLPPLVPALVALSRALLGDSLFADHILPALAGAATLVFVGLITRKFGGKTFAVLLGVLGFIAVPIWLGVDSIFCTMPSISWCWLLFSMCLSDFFAPGIAGSMRSVEL